MLTKNFDELASWHALPKKSHSSYPSIRQNMLIFEGGKHFLVSMLGSAPCSKNINGGPIKWLLFK